MHDRAVDNETRRAVSGATGACYKAAFHEAKNLEFFGHSRAIAAIDGQLRPFADVQVPQGAVIGCHGWNAAQYIQWTTFI